MSNRNNYNMWYYGSFVVFAAVVAVAIAVGQYFDNEQRLACIRARGDWTYGECKFPENRR